MREIDASHIRYRKRAVQRAQFLLLSDRSSQGSVTALLRRYAEDIRTPEQLFEPDDGPVAKRLHLYPAAVFGEKFLYPPAAQRTAEPLAPVRTETFDPEQLRRRAAAAAGLRPPCRHRGERGPAGPAGPCRPPAGERVGVWQRNTRTILPASSACTPTRSRRTGIMTFSSPAIGWSAAASALRTLSSPAAGRKKMATINMLEETANYLLNHCFRAGQRGGSAVKISLRAGPSG